MAKIVAAAMIVSFAMSAKMPPSKCLQLKGIYKEAECCGNKESMVCPRERQLTCFQHPKMLQTMFTSEEIATMRSIENMTLIFSAPDNKSGHHQLAKRCGKFVGWSAQTAFLIRSLTGATMIPKVDPDWATAVTADPSIPAQLAQEHGHPDHSDIAFGWLDVPNRRHSGIKVLPHESFEGFHTIPVNKMVLGTSESKKAILQQIIDDYSGDKSQEYWQAKALFDAGKIQVSRGSDSWMEQGAFREFREGDDSLVYRPGKEDFDGESYEAIATNKADFRIEKYLSAWKGTWFVQSDHIIPGATFHVSPHTSPSNRQQAIIDALTVLAHKGLLSAGYWVQWKSPEAINDFGYILSDFGAEELSVDDPLWGQAVTEETYDPLTEAFGPKYEFHVYDGPGKPVQATWKMSRPCWF
jgi:hypothetical protein